LINKQSLENLIKIEAEKEILFDTRKKDTKEAKIKYKDYFVNGEHI